MAVELNDLEDRLRSDPELERRVKEDPVSALRDFARPLDTDVWIYRIIVLVLGVVVLSTVIGVLLILLFEITPDAATLQILTALASASVGAIAGLLAPSPRK